MSMQKVAAGYGAIARLNQEGIDPVRFVKVAAQSNDQDMRILADCIVAAARDDHQTKTANIGKIPAKSPIMDAIAGAPSAMGGAVSDAGDWLSDLLGQGRVDAARSYMNSSIPEAREAIELIGEGNYDRMANAALEDLPDALQSRNMRTGLAMGGGAAGLAGLGAGGKALYDSQQEPTLMERLGLG
jgi:hypothetical protein